MNNPTLDIQYAILEKAFEDGALDCSYFEKWKQDNGFGAALQPEYEYEYLFISYAHGIKIDTWMPIATDRVRGNVEELISKGRLRPIGAALPRTDSWSGKEMWMVTEASLDVYGIKERLVDLP